MPKESTKATITSFAGTPLVRVVDGTLSRNMSPANLVAETGARAELDGRYAPLEVDGFSEAFPAWFSGGTVNESLEDIVTHMTAYANAGSGQPNGTVTGSVGDRYVDTAATAGARVWYKASGTDTNTGWVVAEGDTGWRDVSASLAANWTAADADQKLLLRRTGNHVFLQGYVVQTTYSAGMTLITLPSGFHNEFTSTNDPGLFFGSAGYNWSSISYWWVDDNLVKSYSNFGATDRHFRFDWFTNDAWPASLPGTAA